MYFATRKVHVAGKISKPTSWVIFVMRNCIRTRRQADIQPAVGVPLGSEKLFETTVSGFEEYVTHGLL